MRRQELIRATAIAAFLAFHVCAVVVRALPSPEQALDRSLWKDPGVMRELDAWSRRLAHVGIHWTGLEVAENGAKIAERYLALRNAALTPFERYYQFCGTAQSWSMFQAPHRFPARMRIDVEEDGQWRTVFRERDPRYPWMDRELSDTRFRSVIFRLGWPFYRGELERFSDFIARRAAKEFPRATRSRVVMERAETLTPEQVKRGEEPKPKDEAPQVRLLAGLRA